MAHSTKPADRAREYAIKHPRVAAETLWLAGYAEGKAEALACAERLADALKRARKDHDWTECDDTIETARLIDEALAAYNAAKGGEK